MTWAGAFAEGPVSFVQEEILARMLAHPACATRYDLIQMIALEGLLDRSRLRRAVEAVQIRHPILRTRLGRVAEGFVQCVLTPDPGGQLVWHMDSPAPEALAARLHAAKLDVPGVLGGAPLFRLHVASDGAGGHLLGVLVHHCVIDSAGYRVLWRDISAAYNGTTLGDLPGDYIAFARAERAAFDADSAPALKFWREMGMTRTALAPEAAPDYATERVPIELRRAARAGIEAAVKRYRMPPFLVALAASGQAFAQLTGAADQLLSSDFENREAAFKRDQVAPFINSRICLLRGVARPLAELLAPLRKMWLDAEAFRDLHAHALRERLGCAEPLSVQMDARDEEVLPAFDGIGAGWIPDPMLEPYWRDAMFSWRLRPGQAEFVFTYRPSRFAPEHADRLAVELDRALAELR